MEAEEAFEAHHVHILEGAEEEAVVTLHHGVAHRAGEKMQPLNGGGTVALHGVGEHVGGVAGQEKELTAVHLGGDLRGVGAQGIGGQAQTLLCGAAHVHQRHVLGEKTGLAVEIRFDDLQLGAAALQVADVLQVAVEVTDLRKEDLSFHCAASFFRSISFSFAFTRKARGIPSTP